MKDDNFNVDFIGIGAPRSATTWLTECLKQHPEIGFSKVKETKFFSDERKYQKGINYYSSFFLNDNQIIGEFSVQYLANPLTAVRIYDHFPQVKLIACLRNPVDMIYSFFWWLKGDGTLNFISFEDLIDNKPEFLEQGLYYQHLRKYYRLFQTDQIQIILYSDIKNNSEQVLNRIYSFLEVHQGFLPDLVDRKINKQRKIRSKQLAEVGKLTQFFYDRGINFDLLRRTGIHKKLVDLYNFVNRKEKKYPPLKDKTRKMLIDYYKSDIRKLEELIDQDLSHWLK
jgi:hypothetical protein